MPFALCLQETVHSLDSKLALAQSEVTSLRSQLQVGCCARLC